MQENSEVTLNWFESSDDSQDEESYTINEYEITTSPNDFNTRTMYDFMESGAIKIPAFQRNYVWDIKRASKLIEIDYYWFTYSTNIPL
ncbi:hypothetical protein ANSO36C_27020 [Nostoc cf. commune SO-36]|uniref:DUF262 domain-containing protein n=1 Tax=Nostoc cf. commune SO-36 TaxID=449208 RepID=A0ABM7Z1Q6_NOSCO|nr:hypothetical protein ANSO36C_27020 [Nostoc cf. commune SO-36]